MRAPLSYLAVRSAHEPADLDGRRARVAGAQAGARIRAEQDRAGEEAGAVDLVDTAVAVDGERVGGLSVAEVDRALGALDVHRAVRSTGDGDQVVVGRALDGVITSGAPSPPAAPSAGAESTVTAAVVVAREVVDGDLVSAAECVDVELFEALR